MALPDVLQGPLSVPVVAAPMFMASGPELVKAQCQAGVIGSFPALNARPASLVDEWLYEIAESNSKIAREKSNSPVAPFAINQIVHRSNERLEEDMTMIIKHKVPIVITSLGVREEINDAVHSYGGIVLHDVIHDRFARKAIEKGADGLIAVAAGAGGHAGSQSPFALLQEIRQWFDGPLILSGAIAHGRAILAALAAGADMAYVGSVFLSTTEARISNDYRRMVLESTAEDIVYTNYFTGVYGNYLRDSISASGLDPDKLPQSGSTAMSFRSKNGHARAWRDIWGCGQGVGVLQKPLTTQQLVKQLAEQYEKARLELKGKIARLVENRVDPRTQTFI